MKPGSRFLNILLVTLLGLMLSACGSSVPGISNTDLKARLDAGEQMLILDVRSAREFASGHVPGAINIPHGQIGDRLAELGDKGQEIIVYCESGVRAGRAESVLSKAGFTNLRHLDGDMAGWRGAGLPQQR